MNLNNEKGYCLQIQGASHIFILRERYAETDLLDNNHDPTSSTQANQYDPIKKQSTENIWAQIKQNYENHSTSFALYLAFRQKTHLSFGNQVSDGQIEDWLHIRLPLLYQLHQGQLPKQLNQRISSSKLKKRKNRKNIIIVENFMYNYYEKLGQFGYFYKPLSKRLKDAQEVLCFYSFANNCEGPVVRNLKQFGNYKQYSPYFQMAQEQFIDEINLQKGWEENRYCIFCIFHKEKCQYTIDAAYLNTYQFSGMQWVLTDKIQLPSRRKSQNKSDKSFECRDTYTEKKETHLSKDYNFNFQRKLLHVQKQKWQSILDLQYILKKLCKKLTFNYFPTHKNQYHDIIKDRSHYIIHFYLRENEQILLVVHNNQATIQQFITKIEYIQEGTLLLQNTKGLIKEIQGLQSTNRLRYPLDYYLQVYSVFCQLVNTLRDRREDHKFRTLLSLLENLIETDQKFKLCQYLLIQNIPACQFLQFLRCSSQQLSTVQQRFFTIISSIKSLGGKSLSFNSTSLTVLVYWAIAPPGASKTEIYGQINQQLAKYSVKSFVLSQFSQLSSAFFTFLESDMVFKQERFAVCFVDDYFNTERYHQLLSKLAQLPSNIFYSLLLVAPETKSPLTFFSQVNNNLHIKQKDLDSNTNDKISSIKTHYFFSFQFLLAIVLNIQKRPLSASKLHGRGVQSLAKLLHYISSVYTNLDLQQLVNNSEVYGGQVRILEYRTLERVKIDWSDINEYEQEQISDQLRFLLQGSYKKVIEEDVLLSYFLENIERIDYSYFVSNITEQILGLTFQSMPYLQQLINGSRKHNSQ